MSDLVERVARAIYIEYSLHGDETGSRDHLRAVFGPDARPDYQHYGVRPREAAKAAIAAMQAEAAPVADKLRPAVEVWDAAFAAWDDTPPNPNYEREGDEAATAVIEADRKQCLAALQAHADAMAGALGGFANVDLTQAGVPSNFGLDVLSARKALRAYEAFKAGEVSGGRRF